MNADLKRRGTSAALLLLAGCGGTLASVHVPPLPEPPPSKFESFEDWDARVNKPTTATAPATTQADAPAMPSS